MAHNLNEINGKTSFMNAGTNVPAWHGLGVVLPELATAEEAIKHANLGYEVAKTPVLYDYMGQTMVNTKRFNTIRLDNGKALGVVGKGYEIVQNTELFGFFDEIVHRGEAIYETAGVLGDGEKVWILAKLPENISIGGHDEIKPYVLLMGSHDGASGIIAQTTLVRVVCANTLQAALSTGKDKVSIPHTKNAKKSMKAAIETLNITTKISKEITEIFTKMAATKVTIEKSAEYLELLIPRTSEVNYKIASDKIKEQILSEIQNGVGQDLDTTKDTLFGFYNGVTHYLDHSKEYKDNSSKLKSIWMGSSAKLRQKAFDLSVELVKA